MSGKDQPGVVEPPDDLQVAGVVLQAHRHVVAGLQAGVAQYPAQAVGGVVELAVRLHDPGPVHDDGGLVRCGGGVGPRVHDRHRTCR